MSVSKFMVVLLTCCCVGAAGVRTEIRAGAEAKATARFRTVPNPSKEDAAENAMFTVVDGAVASESAAVDCLHDGRTAGSADDQKHSFYFEWATLEGRVRVDLGRAIAVGEINTFSWHKDWRGPQVYKVYGSDGTAAGFDPAPKIGVDPAKHGWTKIASVDTRPTNGATVGGQHAVSITDSNGALGRYQYLLFEMFITEMNDPWGHTFYGEIDVVESKQAGGKP
jgi:hypothetical protein